MTFDAREATRAAEATYKPWEFVDIDGATQHLPHPLMVDPGLMRQAQAGEITSAELVERLAPEAAAAIDRMLPAVQRALIEAWRAQVSEELDALGKEPAPSSETPPSAGLSSPT